MGAMSLRHGSRGPDVQRLQELLNKTLRTSPKLRVDGEFGPRTEAALRLYQASIGGRVDGVAGPRTWAALERKLSNHRVTAITGKSANAPWMKVAQQELGQSEIPGPKSNPRILEYHAATSLRIFTDETPWCSSFINWCLRKAGITGTHSAAAISWIHWGKKCDATAGAITIVQNAKAAGSSLTASGYHVGFLMADTHSHYHLLGGNQKDQVKISPLPKSRWRLVGYRWPNH